MKKLLLLLLSGLLILSLTGCFGPPSPPPAPNIFFNAVKNAAPVFEPDRSALIAKATWAWGSPIYEIFRTFRTYDPVLDEGVVGLENIYKLVYQAGQFFNQCQSSGTAIADTWMTSPFNFGRTDNLYNKVLINETATRGNYFATRKVGDINYSLLCWYIEYSATKIERGILQGRYEEVTGIINIDLVCFVDYPDPADPSKYSHRTHLEGNALTHTFSKLIIGKWNDSAGYRAWFVGSGVSRGVGEHFLFKVADNGSLPEPGKYFEFPADADEATLQGMDDTGSDTTTSPYEATVDSLVPYDVLVEPPTQVPTEGADFTGTGMGNMKPGGM